MLVEVSVQQIYTFTIYDGSTAWVGAHEPPAGVIRALRAWTLHA